MLKEIIRRVYRYSPVPFVPSEEGRMEAVKAAQELAEIRSRRARVDELTAELRRQSAEDGFGLLLEKTMRGTG
jgi:hypothetical protein